MPSMNVSLTPELMRVVQHKVGSGLYNNASEVIREAIRQLDTHEELLYQFKLARLREALAEGVRQVENGELEAYSMEEIIAEVDAGKRQ